MKKKINQEESVEIKHINPFYWNSKGITFSLLSLAVFFAFQQSGFGVIDYISIYLIRPLQAIMIISSCFLAFWVFLNSNTLPYLYKRTIRGLILLNTFYALLGVIYKSDINLIFHLESIIYAYLSVIILIDIRFYKALLWLIFLSGALLVMLNMIPILHYLNYIDLNFETIPRLIEVEEYQPDSISFGLFGRAESTNAPEKFFARLHGWSLEPIHWGYFLFLFVATGLILLRHTKSGLKKTIIKLILLLISIHMYFVHSMVVFLGLIMWIIFISILWFFRKFNHLNNRESLIIFLFFLTYGLFIPFAMTFIPGIELLLIGDSVTNKGTNWLPKIGFLSLGSSLFTLFLPSNVDVSSSQNLILQLYLKYGYILLIPFLAFIYRVINKYISNKPLSVTSAGILILLAHLVVVPPYAFHPSFILFVVIIMGSMQNSF